MSGGYNKTIGKAKKDDTFNLLNKWTKMVASFGTVYCAIILIYEYVIRTLPAKLKLLLISVLILM